MGANDYLLVACATGAAVVGVAIFVWVVDCLGRGREPAVPPRDEILYFIGEFWQAKTAFTTGCCYWFAHILNVRFGGRIVLDVVDNHFVTEIGDRYYDVTGDVTERILAADVVIPFDELERYDELWSRRIYRDCVLKLRPED